MTEKTTTTPETPDSISADQLKDLKRKAEQTKEEAFLHELMDRGHAIVDIVCEADAYDEFNDVQALALQAVYNLRCKYEQFCTRAAENIEEGSSDNPRHLMKGIRSYTRLATAFDLIKETLVNLDED